MPLWRWIDYLCRCSPALPTSGQGRRRDTLAGKGVREIDRIAAWKVSNPIAVRANHLDRQFGRPLFANDRAGEWGVATAASVRSNPLRTQAPNAESPVCARPRIRACTSCVPSYVFTASRFITCRIT